MLFKTLALLGILTSAAAVKRYEKFKVYNVIPKSEMEVQMLEDLKKEGYEFWTEILSVDKDARLMVAPQKNEEFLNYASNAGFNVTLSIANVQELIEAQMNPAKIDRSSTLGSFNWIQYHNLAEIHAWLDELVEMYPGIVTTVNIGTSYEGRFLKAIIIDFKVGEREGTPLVGMIEGGIHSREWISPATVTWIIKEFLTSNDPDVRSMAESFVWHILPVANPDGYAYTFDGDRMWRKNRNPANYVACSNNPDLGNGIDLNRNFNFLWMSVGASDQPCTQTYAGPIAASEREAQAISTYVLNLKQTGNLLYYFAFHSYSQMILIPYSHLNGLNKLNVTNYADLYEIAIRGAEKLTEVHGIPYTVGTSKEILYEVSGSSFDWAKGVAEVPITMLFELRDLGIFGFLLPPEQIIPNNEEVMACLIEMDKTTKRLGYYSGSNAVIASVISLALSLGFLVVMK